MRLSRYNEGVSSGTTVEAFHQRLHVKTFLMILVMILTAPLGNVFLAMGMKHVHGLPVWPLPDLLHVAERVLTSAPIWLGIGCLISFFVSYMLVLSWADYSYVQPASSLSYGVVALLGYLILGEKISAMRWAGIAVICLGVFIVSRTSPRTASAAGQDQIG
jgi:drug/metabolite transporter (DMT)-like permease